MWCVVRWECGEYEVEGGGGKEPLKKRKGKKKEVTNNNKNNQIFDFIFNLHPLYENICLVKRTHQIIM